MMNQTCRDPLPLRSPSASPLPGHQTWLGSNRQLTSVTHALASPVWKDAAQIGQQDVRTLGGLDTGSALDPQCWLRVGGETHGDCEVVVAYVSMGPRIPVTAQGHTCQVLSRGGQVKSDFSPPK